MKDATGELSMTAVAVVAIAAIAVVFTTLIWPRIKTNIMRSTYCSQAFNCPADKTCGDTPAGMSCMCYCADEAADGANAANCGTITPIQCPTK